jgi:hypothetical protein
MQLPGSVGWTLRLPPAAGACVGCHARRPPPRCATTRAGEKGFNEDRVRNTVKRINAAKNKASQGRLESFFGPVTVKPNEKKAAKEAAAKAAAKAAKGKGGKGSGMAAKGGVKKAPIAAGKKK